MIGAGTMGGGIAMNFLSAGIPVAIVETSKEALDRGVSIMRRNYENSAKRGRLTMAEVEARMGRLAPSLDFNALSGADLVIEAVYENMDLKKSVFERLDGVAKPGAILASNTSYLDIDEIAAKTKRSEDVLGMHFFSPANVMRLPLRRQPDAGSAPAGGDEARPRRRDAVGRRPRAGRFRHADGAVRDERSRRPRRRLVGRDVEALDWLILREKAPLRRPLQERAHGGEALVRRVDPEEVAQFVIRCAPACGKSSFQRPSSLPRKAISFSGQTKKAGPVKPATQVCSRLRKSRLAVISHGKT